jgi:hypothetical protein
MHNFHNLLSEQGGGPRLRTNQNDSWRRKLLSVGEFFAAAVSGSRLPRSLIISTQFVI